MGKKSIMIFGAGLNQYLLIKESKVLGVTSVVLDPNPESPGKEFADYFYVVGGNDFETTKEIALKHKISGLVTTQMEKPIRLMARLAKEIGLPFHSAETVERSLDKWLMKEAFVKNKVPCAKGKLFFKEQNIKKNDLDYLLFPLILKPKDATSSQGVYRIESFEEISKYEPITRSFSKNSEIIIEEFLDGPEYSVESITFNGKTKVVQLTEKFITRFPKTVELGHLQPAELSNDDKNEIISVVTDAINAIGINNSASHAEIKVTSSGPKIIEIGARGGGDFISSYLTLASTGISMDKAMIQIALNQEPDLELKFNNYSYIKYFELPIGKKVTEVKDYSDLLTNDDVVFANIAIKPGDIIEEITESKKRPGFVIVKGNSRTHVIDRANYCAKLLASKINLI